MKTKRGRPTGSKTGDYVSATYLLTREQKAAILKLAQQTGKKASPFFRELLDAVLAQPGMNVVNLINDREIEREIVRRERELEELRKKKQADGSKAAPTV